ncbi:probable pectinesterase/pectinesterase inhibitor 32 [Asparagus officinalis]|uniref:probable pectinesterase/pectinesterase inhibitor 32 n=1 Tax=Asparagus officinalis TaxID=4686 RepID=UPI00098E4ABA|nr:probable pectinesterase/pectinesterase inhibitor 32 [Asparagus officinalis]
MGVSGSKFIARDLTIENTAELSKYQAVSLRSDSDLSVYYKCAFKGYQDTLYARSGHQFYRDCVITGTVDFIFGDAAAIFQHCQIRDRVALPQQTAHGRQTSDHNTGFSFHLCNITADEDLAKNISQTFTYLGRPWGNFSRTIFMESDLGALIRPEGWLEWDGQSAPGTLYYAEYMNQGGRREHNESSLLVRLPQPYEFG